MDVRPRRNRVRNRMSRRPRTQMDGPRLPSCDRSVSRSGGWTGERAGGQVSRRADRLPVRPSVGRDSLNVLCRRMFKIQRTRTLDVRPDVHITLILGHEFSMFVEFHLQNVKERFFPILVNWMVTSIGSSKYVFKI